MTTIALVLGVHRSGTSLLTRGLIALGASAGDFADSPDEDNPDGYAEHLVVRDFNDRLLAFLGVSWDNWGFCSTDVDWNCSTIVPWLDEAAEILRRSFIGPGPFVLKDPRCATLAPFWELVIPRAGFTINRLLIVRDPAEVAESQRQRVARRPHFFPIIDGPEPMSALWAVTMFSCLNSLTDDSTLLVGHRGLFVDPAVTLSRAASFIGLNPSTSEVDHFVKTGIKPSLYRAHVPNGTQSVADGGWVQAADLLYSALVESGMPRKLDQSEALDIVGRQSLVLALLPGLPAVRSSISQMHKTLALERKHAGILNSLIWQLTLLATNAPKMDLVRAVDPLLGLIESIGIEIRSFAVASSVARVLIHGGAKVDAVKWLNRVRPNFGHLIDFSELDQRVSEMPGEIDQDLPAAQR